MPLWPICHLLHPHFPPCVRPPPLRSGPRSPVRSAAPLLSTAMIGAISVAGATAIRRGTFSIGRASARQGNRWKHARRAFHCGQTRCASSPPSAPARSSAARSAVSVRVKCRVSRTELMPNSATSALRAICSTLRMVDTPSARRAPSCSLRTPAHAVGKPCRQFRPKVNGDLPRRCGTCPCTPPGRRHHAHIVFARRRERFDDGAEGNAARNGDRHAASADFPAA